jgi:hypothetical protein
MPPIKSSPGGYKRLSWVIPGGKKQTTEYQPTRRGVKETSRSGPRKCQLLATPYVVVSLALVALGSSDPTDKFSLGTLSIGWPHGNHGAHFGYCCHIPGCGGHVIRGVGVVRKLVFTAPFYNVCKGPPLCLLSC